MNSSSAISNQSIEDKLTQFVTGARFETLSQLAVTNAKKSLIDSIAAMIAGSEGDGADRIVDLAQSWGGASQAPIFGTSFMFPPLVAALLNGASARRLELDDIVDFVPLHPSGSAVAGLLAVCSASKPLSGRRFLTALAVAQDINIRFAVCLNRHALETGRYNMFQVIAVSAGICSLLRLSSEVTHNALGIAYSFAFGELQSLIEGTSAVALHDGLVAHNGVLAVMLASAGQTGPRAFLTGRHGFFSAFEPEADPERLVEGLGKRYHGELISHKPYAACRAAHPGIEAALGLRERPEFALDNLNSIVVETSPAVINLVFPQFRKINGDRPSNLLFSLPHLMAQALTGGEDATILARPNLIQSEDTNALAHKITGIEKTANTGDDFLGTTCVRASYADMPETVISISQALGSPERPLSFRRIFEKLKACSTGSSQPLSTFRLEHLRAITARLEQEESMSGFVSQFLVGKSK